MERKLVWGAALLGCLVGCDTNRPDFTDRRGGSLGSTSGEATSGLADGGVSNASGASTATFGSTQGSSASQVTSGSNRTDDSEDNEDSDTADTEEPEDSDTADSQDTGQTTQSGCEVGRKRPCSANGAKGNCADGEEECGDDGEWGACSVTAEDEDDCSEPGDDADCDGTPNSGCECTDDEQQDCGPEEEVGRCKTGKSVCAGGTYQPCEGAVEAAARDCASSADNDCDGTPDNTIDQDCKCVPGMTQPCEEHEGLDGHGQCEAGEQVCEASSDGTTSEWGDCIGSVGPELQDSCDGEDDGNCNGVLNEGCSCTGNAECNDNATCTTDVCQQGSCVNAVQAAFCRIDGQCIAHNAKDPNNPCRYCDSALNQTAWTNAGSTVTCDDEIWCNGTDNCNGAGQCSQHQFATHRCDDETGPCVLDSCDEENRTCFRDTDYVCDPGEEEYECTGSENTCGSDVRAFTVQRHCNGTSGQCSGAYNTVEGGTEDCGSGYCDGDSFTCEQLGCGNTWCNEGLCWTTDNPTKRTLANAETYCAGLGRHGKTWRLPSITEWMDIGRGCNDATGMVIDDVDYHSTCDSIPCDNDCDLLEGPGPGGCYWPTEMGSCNGEAGNYSEGRFWSSTGGNWFQPATNWIFTLSTEESLNVRCVTSGSGP